MNYSKQKLTEQDKRDIQYLKEHYACCFMVLDKCVEKNYLSLNDANEIKKDLAEKFYVGIFLTPHMNRILSQAEKMISKGLERVLKNKSGSTTRDPTQF